MRKVTYSMGVTLDGYYVDADDSFDWSTPSDELFRSSIEEIKDVGVHLLGRRMYEAMLYWEQVDPATLDDDRLEWRDLWNALPKVVFSRTLTEVDPSARLATGTLTEEIERLRAEDVPGDIAIAGPELATQAARAGLIDEYLLRIYPVLVGGGRRYFAHDEQQVRLEVYANRTFDNGVVGVRYRVQR